MRKKEWEMRDDIALTIYAGMLGSGHAHLFSDDVNLQMAYWRADAFIAFKQTSAQDGEYGKATKVQ